MAIRKRIVKNHVLPKSFYKQDTISIARSLLGKNFTRIFQDRVLMGKIVETEAYHEIGDPSCHAHRGKTVRNAVMFGQPGHLYVYFTYGMHYCMNVVTEAEGIAAAVLIRALEPFEGIDIMQKNRGVQISQKNLCNGPAKLCQAFGITKEQNGQSLQSEDLYIADGDPVVDSAIVVSTRIGISKGKDLPWRFYIKNNPFVSKI